MKNKVLNIVVWKEGRLYVSKFIELELASQGKTVQGAINNLKEALSLYLDDKDGDKITVPQINQVSTHTISLN